MLQQTLEQLTEEGRKNFLEQLVERGCCNLGDEDFEEAYQAAIKIDVNLGAKYLYERHRDDQAVSLLENNKKYLDAAELCKELSRQNPQWKDRAVENFLTAKETKKAVEVYLEVDDYRLELTEVVLGVGLVDHLDELEKYENKKDYLKAAGEAKNLGMIKRTAENLRLAGRNEDAEELLKNSDILKAVQVWERKGKISEAVNLLFRNDYHKEISALYERVGDFFSAGMSHYWNNKLEKALECYIKANYNEGISRLLSQLGRQEDLVKHWEETNNFLSLAEHYQDKNPEKASEFYLKLKDYKKSAECLVRVGNKNAGMVLLAAKEYFEDALKIAEKEEINPWLIDFLKSCYKGAAIQNEKSQPSKSLEYYEKAGEKEKVKELGLKLMKQSELSGDFNKALFYSRKAEDKTAEEVYGSLTGFLS